MPEFWFNEWHVKIYRYSGQADSTEALQAPEFNKFRFPNYDEANFPLSYSVNVLNGGSVPIVSFDDIESPSMLTITGMALVSDGNY